MDEMWRGREGYFKDQIMLRIEGDETGYIVTATMCECVAEHISVTTYAIRPPPSSNAYHHQTNGQMKYIHIPFFKMHFPYDINFHGTLQHPPPPHPPPSPPIMPLPPKCWEFASFSPFPVRTCVISPPSSDTDSAFNSILFTANPL